MNMEKQKSDLVWLVGAGPGDAGLITKKGYEVLQQADIVIYDALISSEVLRLIPESAEKIYVGKRSGIHSMSQEKINEVLLQAAKTQKKVVRLKGGDPFVFGRGGEEVQALLSEHIPFEIVPGVTSATAVPAYFGIPVTHRDYASSFHVISGHRKGDGSLDLNYEAMVHMGGTLIFLMGIGSMKEICLGLLAGGMDPEHPAAILSKGTTANQRGIFSTLGKIARMSEEEREKIETPAVLIIGKVCGLAEQFSWAEKRPLHGITVVVTRQREKTAEFAARLRLLGAEAFEIPAIHTVEFCPAETEKGIRALCGVESMDPATGHDTPFQAEKTRWLVFTSPRGVDSFFHQLENEKLDLRLLLSPGSGEKKFAVVGASTGTALAAHGIYPDYMPKEYSGQALGRGLGEIAGNQDEINLFLAREHDPELTEELKMAGKNYHVYPIYATENVLEPEEKDQLRQLFSGKKTGEVILSFTSASCVRGFTAAAKGIDLRGKPALCIGSKTAKAAEMAGMIPVISEKASMDSMVDRLTEWAAVRKAGNR